MQGKINQKTDNYYFFPLPQLHFLLYHHKPHVQSVYILLLSNLQSMLHTVNVLLRCPSCHSEQTRQFSKNHIAM
jgi:hypothetical protein